ncbi:uncharacterized protein I206_107081 [Kwoniella pini CBS 10737]|uniref:Uncharacterized protein n=1 Tax=Kwoniella pini CBS 10737 TaxID=1296096 RepID=A0A1B9HZ96_9TREE|nr:uncharacterized protein I206_05375 [Kwoniella pini CBS 10737]OCF48596.1 hypothetical protein I206_05375 [Kwoniella pini CBS 10737]
MSDYSKALIIWQPKYLFFPPVQEPPPPTKVFRHVDLDQGHDNLTSTKRTIFGPTAAQTQHTPDHISIFPQLFLNDTFLRFILNLPRSLPNLAFTDQLSAQHVTNSTVQSNSSPPIEAYLEPIEDEDEITLDEEKESSLESIDETSTILPHPASTPSPIKRTIKPTKIILKRKSPDSESFINEEDVFINTDKSGKKPKVDETLEQWRVGKRPGFQGSFIAPKKVSNQNNEGEDEEGIRGKKRTINEDINNSAEKVLKKPFRPPTRVMSKPKSQPQFTKDESSFDLPSLSSNTEGKVENPIYLPKVDPFFPEFPTPPSSHSGKSRESSKISVKPFKTPSKTTNSNTERSRSLKSNQIYHTPKSIISIKVNSNNSLTSTSTSTSSISNQSEIINLQNEIMITKQALKYLKEEKEDNKLSELIEIWKIAGREIVENLFKIIPEPLNFENQNINSNYTRNNFSFNEDDDSMNNKMTYEQIENLKNLPKNKDGELCDEDGNLLILEVSQKEQDDFWEGIGKDIKSSPRGKWSNNAIVNYDRLEDRHKNSDSIETTSQEWNYAALMKMFGVDPALLGWNYVEEDWQEMDG